MTAMRTDAIGVRIDLPPTRSPILFDPLSHSFSVDGQPVPGVTSILKAAGLGVDYSKIPPATLEWARMRGKHIDECCTLLDEGVLDWASVAEEAKPYVDAWDAFKVGTGFLPDLQQPLGYHPDLGYCGIPDTIGAMPDHASGRFAVCVERKATDRVYRTHGLQLAAYTMPGFQLGPALPTHRMVVQLKKDGTYAVYTDHPDDAAGRKIFSPSDWDTFKAACVIARWKGAA